MQAGFPEDDGQCYGPPMTRCRTRILAVLLAPAVCLGAASAAADALRVSGIDRTLIRAMDEHAEYLVTVRFINDADQVNAEPTVEVAVPGDAQLIEGSATGPGAEVSIVVPRTEPEPGSPGGDVGDGGSDGSLEHRTTGAGQPRDELADDAPSTAGDVGIRIRWRLPGPMDPGVTGIVSFRITAPWDLQNAPADPVPGPEPDDPEEAFDAPDTSRPPIAGDTSGGRK